MVVEVPRDEIPGGLLGIGSTVSNYARSSHWSPVAIP